MSVYRKTITALVASASLCGASVAAVAPVSSAPVNPYAVIGVYGSPVAAQTVCANAATTAVVGAAAAAAAQAPAPGCVLPVVDPAVAAPVEPAATVLPAGGPSIAPLLLGLVGIAGIAALIASQNGDDGPDVPTPVSPV